MKKLFKRHYNAIVKRGLITPNTTIDDFFEKISEEFNELQDCNNNDEFIQESIDTMMVVVNMLIYLDVDIEKELLKNILKNENRKD